MNKKKTYEVVGRTIAGTFVSVGFCSDVQILYAHFLKRYPRFKGNARVRTQMAEDMGDGLLVADTAKWEVVDSFESSKQLKDKLSNHLFGKDKA